MGAALRAGRLSPTAPQIMFTGDAGDYGDVHLTPTPDVDRPPEAETDPVS